MNIEFIWVGGATWILKTDTVKIICDPVLCPKGQIQDYRFFKTIRQNDPVYTNSDIENTDIFLLTHNHEDHLDHSGVEIIGKNSTVVFHKSLRRRLKPLKNNLQLLTWGKCVTLRKDNLTIKIFAIPAIHAKRSIFGPVIGNGNGYFVEITDNKATFQMYCTGDSVYNKNVLRFLPNRDLDLVIVNAGAATVGKTALSKIIGRITNNIDDIKALYHDLNPKLLIPVHWGTFSHYNELIYDNFVDSSYRIKILKPGAHQIIK